MGLISKIGKLVLAIIRQPRLLGGVLHDDRYWRRQFERAFGHTTPLSVLPLSLFVPENAMLDKYVFLGGGSMITDLLLLRHLAMRADVRSYFEIGSWRGESLAAVADHVEQAHSLDLDEKTMNQLGFPQPLKDQMGILVKDDTNIVYHKSDSATFDFAHVGKKFDLVFIDAKHTYEYVQSDTRNVLKHLCHEKTIVVWHDYGHDPENVRWEVFKAILDTVEKDRHDRLTHIGNTKCAVLLPEEYLRTQKGQFPQKLNRLWSIRAISRPLK